MAAASNCTRVFTPGNLLGNLLCAVVGLLDGVLFARIALEAKLREGSIDPASSRGVN